MDDSVTWAKQQLGNCQAGVWSHKIEKNLGFNPFKDSLNLVLLLPPENKSVWVSVRRNWKVGAEEVLPSGSLQVNVKQWGKPSG